MKLGQDVPNDFDEILSLLLNTLGLVQQLYPIRLQPDAGILCMRQT